MEDKKRVFSLDLIRALAVFFVLSLHYWIYCGFYGHTMNSFQDFIVLCVRWLFWNCVPLFMLLTGYLNGNKKISSKYYKGLVPIIGTYVFYSFLTIIYKIFYLNIDINFWQGLLKIFDFTAIEYGWYIKMYIGLFLIIPFLNILYKNIPTKKEKQILIITLILLVAIPSLINCIKIDKYTLALFPDWWVDLYPLLYYFIALYIKEYKIKINKIMNIFMILFLTLMEGLITFLYYKNSGIDYSLFESYSCLFPVIMSTLIFILLYDIECKNNIIKKVILSISKLSLDIYLISFICDNFFYHYFERFFVDTDHMIFMYFCLVPLNFLLAFLLSIIKKSFTCIIKKILKKHD